MITINQKVEIIKDDIDWIIKVPDNMIILKNRSFVKKVDETTFENYIADDGYEINQGTMWKRIKKNINNDKSILRITSVINTEFVEIDNHNINDVINKYYVKVKVHDNNNNPIIGWVYCDNIPRHIIQNLK